MITREDLNNKLCDLDEVTLIEILELSSKDIVERSQDIIEEKLEFLLKEFRFKAFIER